MAKPRTRQELIDYCLRRLGAPVIEINVDPDQVEERIDDAFQFFRDYHFDATEKVYLAHEITQLDKDQKFIDIKGADSLITSVIRVIPMTNAAQSMGMFDIQYQMRLHDLYTFQGTSIINYDMMMQRLALLKFEFNTEPSLRWNRHQGKLYIEMDWDNLQVGSHIIIECYRVLDPDQYPDMYDDRWLKMYATALIKRQWGTNLGKLDGVILPGGITLKGGEIYQQANEEINKIEEEVQNRYELPVDFMIG
jgi:hypothetical protein